MIVLHPIRLSQYEAVAEKPQSPVVCMCVKHEWNNKKYRELLHTWRCFSLLHRISRAASNLFRLRQQEPRSTKPEDLDSSIFDSEGQTGITSTQL